MQIFIGILHYQHQEPLVEFRKIRRFISKDYIPISTSKKSKLGYPEDQFSIIMDTFKGQHNEKIMFLCLKNNCELAIVPNNLTNKFQPLDITINQKTKKFVSNQLNKWYTE